MAGVFSFDDSVTTQFVLCSYGFVNEGKLENTGNFSFNFVVDRDVARNSSSYDGSGNLAINVSIEESDGLTVFVKSGVLTGASGTVGSSSVTGTPSFAGTSASFALSLPIGTATGSVEASLSFTFEVSSDNLTSVFESFRDDKGGTVSFDVVMGLA